MTEHHEKIRATVTELEAELRQLESVDAETRAVLKGALQEILEALQADETEGLECGSVTDRLGQAAREFEGSHPTVSGIIGRLVDGLGQMGI